MCVLLTEENQGKIGFAATADLGENSAMSSTWHFRRRATTTTIFNPKGIPFLISFNPSPTSALFY